MSVTFSIMRFSFWSNTVITCSCCLNTKLAEHTSCCTTCSFTAILLCAWNCRKQQSDELHILQQQPVEDGGKTNIALCTILHGSWFCMDSCECQSSRRGASLQPKSNQSLFIHLHLFWACILSLLLFSELNWNFLDYILHLTALYVQHLNYSCVWFLTKRNDWSIPHHHVKEVRRRLFALCRTTCPRRPWNRQRSVEEYFLQRNSSCGSVWASDRCRLWPPPTTKKEVNNQVWAFIQCSPCDALHVSQAAVMSQGGWVCEATALLNGR